MRAAELSDDDSDDSEDPIKLQWQRRSLRQRDRLAKGYSSVIQSNPSRKRNTQVARKPAYRGEQRQCTEVEEEGYSTEEEEKEAEESPKGAM